MSYKFNPFTGNLDEVSSVTALNVKGTVADSTALNALTGMAVGDVYQQEDNDVFYVYDGANWDALGTLVGPQGAAGPAGPAGPAGADGADGADGANGTGVAAGGTAGQVLTKSSGTDYNTTWTTISTGGLGNVVEDTTPQLGGTLDLNGNNISGGDNVEIILGDGPDLKLYHDGSNSYVEDTGTGALIMKGSTLRFRSTNNENIINSNQNGSVELYYDNSKKIETTSTGIDVTGHVEADTLNVSGATTFQSNVDFSDSIRLRVGDGNDLQLYHDGTDSYIEDSGTGSLIFKGSFFKFRDTSNNNIFQASSNFLYLLKPFSTFNGDDIELDPDGTGVVVFKGNATKGSGQFKLNCEQNSHGVTIKGPPHSAAASYTLTLPNTDGNANEVLKTDGSGVLDWVDTAAATETLTNKTIVDPAITGTILEDVYTITDGAGFEVDPGNGSVQLVTLGANRTPQATNFAAGESVTLMVADGTAYTLTWSHSTWGGSGVAWVGGSAPTLATTGYTVLQFWKVGTQIYGASVGDVA